jgi:hypothetical protein
MIVEDVRREYDALRSAVPGREVSMERNHYDAESLERVLARFEERYALTSRDFYAALVDGEELPPMPGFHRHVWASFYRDVERLRAGFARRAEDLLALH